MILDIILPIVKLIMQFRNEINNKTYWAATIIRYNIALRFADDNRNIDADNDSDNEINNEINEVNIIIIIATDDVAALRHINSQINIDKIND